MSVTVRACFLIVLLQVFSFSVADDSLKRAPQGFQGMRGKKLYDYEDMNPYEKRKSQGFIGVKGKKDLFNYLAQKYDPYYPYGYYKRAPMGFMGMRGKKEDKEGNVYYPQISDYTPRSSGSIFGEIDYASNEDPNVEDGESFPILSELLKIYQQQKYEQNMAYSDGHHGSDKQIVNDKEMTVGTKSTNDSNDITAYDNPGSDERALELDLNKRASKMNHFFGMRGKKSDTKYSYRGNKRPFDLSFKGKFVGVRGKKDLQNSDLKEIKFLLDHNAAWPKRKGPGSGFVGMRGKKWIDSDFSSEDGIPN